MNLDLEKSPSTISIWKDNQKEWRRWRSYFPLEIEEYYRIDAKPHQNGFVGCAQTVADVLDTLQSEFCSFRG